MRSHDEGCVWRSADSGSALSHTQDNCSTGMSPVSGKPISNGSTDRPTTVGPRTCSFAIIDLRPLLRECLVQGIAPLIDDKVEAFAGIDEWQRATVGRPNQVLLLSLSNGLRSNNSKELIAAAQSSRDDVSVVALGDAEEPDAIVEMLRGGVRGFIPTSFPLKVTVQALKLVSDGGVFVPATSLMRACQHLDQKSTSISCISETDLFTSRQAAVVRAIACGKANKTIAYELNMCESTVKVHVRNIMKKLQARNRTEVALIAQSLNLTTEDRRPLPS